MKKNSKIALAGRLAVYSAVLALLLSGLGMAWEPARQIHGALAMLALLGLGALAGHISTGWTAVKNRLAGALLLGVLGGLIMSAWMLYYASPGALRDLASQIHRWLGYALIPILVLHIVRGRATRLH